MKKFFENFSIMGFIMLMLCVVLGVGDVSGAVMCANGTATAIGEPVASPAAGEPAGTEGTAIQHGTGGAIETTDHRKWSLDSIKDPIDQKLVLIRPYDTPLDTLLRYMGSMQTNNFEFGWYSMGSRPVEDAVAANYSEGTYNVAADYRGELTVSNIGIFYETATAVIPKCQVPIEVGSNETEDLQIYIYEVDKTAKKIKFTVSEENLTLSSGNYILPVATGRSYAICKDDEIYVLGRAAQELDVKSPATSYLPKKSKGFCQLFMTQIAMSAYEKIMDKEIKLDLSEVEETALWEYRRLMNGTLLFGKGGYKFFDPAKDAYVYTTEGVYRTVLKMNGQQTLTTANGHAALVSMMKTIFTGNNGATERFALMGSDAMEKLTNLLYSDLNKQIGAVETKVIAGIEWRRIVDNFGTLNFIKCEAFDDYGHSNEILVIDPEFLKKWQLTNFERQQVDGKEHLIINGDIVIFREACGVAVYNPPVHSIWKVV